MEQACQLLACLSIFWTTLVPAACAVVPVEKSEYADTCKVRIREQPDVLEVTWPASGSEHIRIRFAATGQTGLVKDIALLAGDDERVVARDLDPVFFVTVGTREAPSGRPPWLAVWDVFFDKPARRPYQRHRSVLRLKRVRVSGQGQRARVAFGDLEIGPFAGQLLWDFYAGSRLVRIEAAVATQLDRRAILYDAGLVGGQTDWQQVVWVDTQGARQAAPVREGLPARTLAVRYRTVIAAGAHGAVALFPPPHQFHFPRDWTDNLRFVWYGTQYQGLEPRFGIGIRQEADGGRAFEPWFNAPPGVIHRLGLFCVPAADATRALDETLRWTNGDRFVKLPGRITFTTHYHMAVAVSAMERTTQNIPEFIGVFKRMGVEAVHLADFHGDGHPKDPGPLRLPELEMLFRECERLSDSEFLLIPGEEVNEFLGLAGPGRHPGHWMCLFPRPVYWIMRRQEGQPFVEYHGRYGRVYRVGSRQDMIELLRRERGLAWTAHPRIKASSWTPDAIRHEDFYLADFWLGAAWKAMPADLSRPKLGERALQVLDDMANWGQKKYLPGEVDVFKIDHTHELYGHMNVNYLRLDRLPRFEQGWQPILDALRAGKFFVTTGEILVHDFRVAGRESGDTVHLPATGRVTIEADIAWTFPLAFAELVSGDGARVYRYRIELGETQAFDRKTWRWQLDLWDRRWVRLEVWDVAVNGAFTQPVWIAQ